MALGHRTTAVFDALNRQVASVSPLGYRTTTTFDAVGNVATTKDGVGNTTSFGYDALDRRVTATDPLGFVTTSVFDAVGNVTRLTDASGNSTTWVYDALNRAVTEINPYGASATTAFDAAGRTTSETDRLGRRRDFGYDNADRLTTEKWYSTAGTLTQTQTWTYDAASRMLTAQDPDGRYTLTYDAAGRVTQVLEPFSQVLTFGYDAAGNRTSVKDSKGGVTTVTFDVLDRQLSEQMRVSGAGDVRFDYAYDARGQVSSLTRYKAIAGGAANVVGTTAYSYDADGRETNIKSTTAAAAVLANYTYTYDAADRLATKVENGTTTTFGYDVTSQLTQDGVRTFGYDATGNRTNSGYATGTGNRTTNDGTWTYTYDAEGNLTKKSKGTSAETWVYAYDNRNQMVTATKSATNGGAATTRVTYSFDAYGNRIRRDHWNGSTTTLQRFLQDGWDPAKPTPVGTENFDTWIQLDSANAVVRRWAAGVGFNEYVTWQTSASVVSWFLTDNQGSSRQYINNAGTVTATSSFDAYGNLLAGTYNDAFSYTGLNFDAALGDYYAIARMYNPRTGRFGSEDPKGFAAGDANLFRYVGNGPTNATDPSGMEPPQTAEWWQDNRQSLISELGDWEAHYTALTDPQKKAQVKAAIDQRVKFLAEGERVLLRAELGLVPPWQGDSKVIPIPDPKGGWKGGKNAEWPKKVDRDPFFAQRENSFDKLFTSLYPKGNPYPLAGSAIKPIGIGPDFDDTEVWAFLEKAAFYMEHTAGVAFGGLEVAGGTALLVTPEPTLMTKLTGSIALGDGFDTIAEHINSIINGRRMPGAIETACGPEAKFTASAFSVAGQLRYAKPLADGLDTLPRPRPQLAAPKNAAPVLSKGDAFEASVKNTFRKKIIRENEVLRNNNGGVLGQIDFETSEAIVEVGISLKGKTDQLHKLAEIAAQRAKRLDVIYGPDTAPGTLKFLQESLRKKWGNRVRFIPHE